MELTNTEHDKRLIFPDDVCGIIDYYIAYKLDKGLSKVGETFFLPLSFVSVLKMVLRDNGIPCDYEETLPEPCRTQIANIVWDNVDEIIDNSQRFREGLKEEN